MIFKQIKIAWQNFSRNFWLSLATIIIIILSLFSVSLLLAVNAVTGEAINIIGERINVSIYFKPGVGEQKITEMRDSFLKMSEVERVIYISKEEALMDFQEKHKNDPLIMKSLTELEENPLSDSLVIHAHQGKDYPTILAFSEQEEFEDIIWSKKFNEDYKQAIEKLNQISRNIQFVVLGITAIFIFISVLVIITTIRLGIYSYREEIEIMRLVGATNGFIRLPFLWQTLFYGFLAWLIHLIIFFPLLSLAQPHLSNFLGGDSFILSEYFQQYFLLIFGLELLGVLILNVFSSILSMRKYLKV